MFWWGIFLTLISGLLSNALIKKKIKNKYSKLNNKCFDIILIVLLLLGIVISSFKYHKNELSYNKLRTEIRTIATFDGIVSVRVHGNWTADIPPSGPVNFMFGAKEVLSLNLNTSSQHIKKLNFAGQGSPSYGQLEKENPTFQFKITPVPGSWIIGMDKEEIIKCGSGSVKISGLYSAITSDSTIQIDTLLVDIHANGSPFIKIIKDVDRNIVLNPGSNTIYIEWDESNCETIRN